MEAMLLLGIGGTEWLVIGAAVLLFFGAKRIPEFAKGLGKGIREFKNAVNDVNQDVENSTKDVKKNIDSARDAGRIEMKD
ncbi:MAG: twin-arginine translocase TatA/TatE family subunit [Cyclobacteriaceae bacterium]|jgi:sec-independent protein translocase protein TatA|nr:twin-arginine translocase TatA/TatE family subunit [Cytophagales bacterium]MCZ8328743.1 twin-arginine translocase TatA/TatE family subunit [Cyclobacteriaceae bacterium]MCZ8355041.1 twin-arginine translocase TatA/TatE family subunit [Cyclobacteriaceae bacterium]